MRFGKCLPALLLFVFLLCLVSCGEATLTQELALRELEQQRDKLVRLLGVAEDVVSREEPLVNIDYEQINPLLDEVSSEALEIGDAMNELAHSSQAYLDGDCTPDHVTIGGEDYRKFEVEWNVLRSAEKYAIAADMIDGCCALVHYLITHSGRTYESYCQEFEKTPRTGEPRSGDTKTSYDFSITWDPNTGAISCKYFDKEYGEGEVLSLFLQRIDAEIREGDNFLYGSPWW